MLFLYRMARPMRIRPNMERFFCIRKSKISACLQTFSGALNQVSIMYLQNIALWHPRMPQYAAAVQRREPLIDNCWGLIDATIRRTCKPTRFQDVFYTRYKRCHGLKFQSIVTPDGMIACLHGPFSARRHDATILSWSGVIQQLQALMPLGGHVLALYGDLAYPECPWLYKGFVNPEPGTWQANFNGILASVRIAVEWGFNLVVQLWNFIDFQSSMRVFKVPVAQYYMNAAFLTNLRSCCMGNKTSHYFNIAPPTLQEYLDLVG